MEIFSYVIDGQLSHQVQLSEVWLLGVTAETNGGQDAPPATTPSPYFSPQDSMGNKEALSRGSVQYMSAGTGVTHSVGVDQSVRLGGEKVVRMSDQCRLIKTL